MTASERQNTDFMEGSIIKEPHTNAQRFRNRVYKHVLRHRDLFGYPRGCNSAPYMFVSNDLSGIFLEFAKLLEKHKDSDELEEVRLDFMNTLTLLIRSYDDVDQCSHGCCSYWHSVSKDVFIELKNHMKDQMNHSKEAENTSVELEPNVSS